MEIRKLSIYKGLGPHGSAALPPQMPRALRSALRGDDNHWEMENDMLIRKTPEKEMDVRIREKLIQKGLLTTKDIDQHLKQLKDESANVLEIDPYDLDEEIVHDVIEE